MQDNISVLLATIIFVILIVIFPIYNIASRHDSVATNIVIKATTSFVDDIRNKGYLTPDNYQEYINQISTTGNVYEVELEVHRKIIMQNKNGDYVDAYEKEYTKDILEQLESKIKIDEGLSDADALNKVAEYLNSENTVAISNIYPLSEGDKIYVRVRNTNMTQAQVLLYNVFRGVTDSKILVNYGGEVYNSEWAKSNLAENIATNISISRPKSIDGIEYSMKPIAVSGDEEGEVEYLYGLAVSIKNNTEKIRFDLQYSNIDTTTFIVNADNKVENASDIVELNGFTGNIEIVKNTDNIYHIIIDNIALTAGNEQATCYIRVKEGTAITKHGEYVASVVSPEFIIYRDMQEYDIDDLQAIQIVDDKSIDVKSAGNAEPTDGKATVIFTAPEVSKDDRVLKEYIWQISNQRGAPLSITPDSGVVEWLQGKDEPELISIIKTTSNKITVEFSEEVVTEEDIINGNVVGNFVKVVAKDENGVNSKTKGVVFGTIKDYMKKTVNGYVARVVSLKMSGATVESATFDLQVSSGHGTYGLINNGDRYRIIGIDKDGDKVILVDWEMDKIKKLKTSTETGTETGTIKNDDIKKMEYIDQNNNNQYDDGEYYIANDITLSDNNPRIDYNTTLGFKTIEMRIYV